MTKLLMCSGVSSITQQLAERMSQAWGQGQAQARGQPGWPERQKDCIWNSAGTLLSWSSESWQSTQMGPGPLLLLRASWRTPSKEETGPGFVKQHCRPSLDQKIPTWAASGNQRHWEVLRDPQAHLISCFSIAVGKHLTRNSLKKGTLL